MTHEQLLILALGVVTLAWLATAWAWGSANAEVIRLTVQITEIYKEDTALWEQQLERQKEDTAWFLETCELLNDRTVALQSIAAQETPGANATVKRMARMAREAVK